MILLVAWGVVYLLPSAVGLLRRVTHVERVVLLNVLLGWTIVGWIVAMVMAIVVPRRP